MTRILLGLLLASTPLCSQTSAHEAMEHHEHKPSAASSTLTLSGAGKTLRYTLADLQAMPQRRLVVHNGHSNVDETYTGVALSDLLEKLGYNTQGEAAKRVYHSYLRAEGTDKYFVLFSMSEIEPSLREGDTLVAFAVDGKPLKEDGAFKLVNAGEKKPARWVRNLASISVVTVE